MKMPPDSQAARQGPTQSENLDRLRRKAAALVVEVEAALAAFGDSDRKREPTSRLRDDRRGR